MLSKKCRKLRRCRKNEQSNSEREGADKALDKLKRCRKKPLTKHRKRCRKKAIEKVQEKKPLEGAGKKAIEQGRPEPPGEKSTSLNNSGRPEPSREPKSGRPEPLRDFPSRPPLSPLREVLFFLHLSQQLRAPRAVERGAGDEGQHR